MSSFVQANTNGRLHAATEPSLSPLNRGFLYGDAIYEVWRTYGGRIFGWEEHWDRLRGSASALSMAVPLEPGALQDEIRRTVEAYRNHCNDAGDVYVRLQIYRGEGRIGLDPALAGAAGYVLLVQAVPQLAPQAWAAGMTLAVAQTLRRNPIDALNPAWKTGNYLNNLLCLHEARQRGADDVLILNQAGEITEAATANIAFVCGTDLVTPPLSVGILAGVTRRLVMEHVAQRAGLNPVERVLNPADLSTMDEAMLLSSTKDIQPVGRIDDVLFRVGEGTHSRALKTAFNAYAIEHLGDRADLAV